MNNSLLERAKKGIDIDAFMRSPTGQHLLKCATNDSDSALLELATVDPDDSKLIREIQNKYHRADSFFSWIESALLDGEYAVNEIENED